MEKCCEVDSFFRRICSDGSGILGGCQSIRAPPPQRWTLSPDWVALQKKNM